MAVEQTADLSLRLKRHADGSASLTCTRRDGSVTWQRHNRQTALAMPAHDLTHYAVETTLGYNRGFYGLLADGWEITDFASRVAVGKRMPNGRRPLTNGELERVRVARAELLARWTAVPAGEVLDLEFTRGFAPTALGTQN